MELGIRDKVALVLGGGGGLGRVIARTLIAEGAKVAISDRSEDSLKSAMAEIGSDQSLAVQWELGDHGVIDSNVSLIERELGPVDILVNITGGPPPTPVTGQPVEVWSDQFQAMVMSVVAITDRVVPGMKERGLGPHHHQHVVGHPLADPEPRPVQRAAVSARRLVEDRVE